MIPGQSIPLQPSLPSGLTRWRKVRVRSISHFQCMKWQPGGPRGPRPDPLELSQVATATSCPRAKSTTTSKVATRISGHPGGCEFGPDGCAIHYAEGMNHALRQFFATSTNLAADPNGWSVLPGASSRWSKPHSGQLSSGGLSGVGFRPAQGGRGCPWQPRGPGPTIPGWCE